MRRLLMIALAGMASLAMAAPAEAGVGYGRGWSNNSFRGSSHHGYSSNRNYFGGGYGRTYSRSYGNLYSGYNRGYGNSYYSIPRPNPYYGGGYSYRGYGGYGGGYGNYGGCRR